jgi:hypothetical protein
MGTIQNHIIGYLREHRGSSVEAIVFGVYSAKVVNKANLWRLSAQIDSVLPGTSEAINISPLPKASLEDRINASRWKLKE